MASDEYPWIKSGLDFLKFDPQDVADVYEAISTTIKITSSVVSIVGFASGVLDLAKSLGIIVDQEEEDRKRLKKMGAQIEAIYKYLQKEEEEERWQAATKWRSALTNALAWRKNATKVSRGDKVLADLSNVTQRLDEALNEMFGFSGRPTGADGIAFLRDNYVRRLPSGVIPLPTWLWNWISAAKSPFMTLANGAAIDYASTDQNLAGRIWDPGYYIDILVRALEGRVAALVALEPQFHSTGLDRDKLADISDKLSIFIQDYRDALFVAVPSAGLVPAVSMKGWPGKRGLVRNPYSGDLAADGIVLGVFDPVTGASNVGTWSDFDIKYEFDWPWDIHRPMKYETVPMGKVKNPYKPSWVVDLPTALDAATAEQARRMKAILPLTLIPKLSELQQEFFTLSQPPNGSEFVGDIEPAFNLLGVRTEVSAESVDLGRFKKYSPTPEKTYPARRFQQQIEKRFRFRIAKRADYSGVQLGYRITVGEHSFTLCEYDPGDGTTALTAIDTSITLRVQKFDCIQTRAFSPAQEDEFDRTGQSSEGDRILLNPRPGDAQLNLRVDYLKDGGRMVHWREVEVTLQTPADLEDADLDAYVVGVQVFEEHLGHDGPEEVVADQFTTAIIPTYLVVGEGYLDDLYSAMLTSAKAKVHAELEIGKSWRDLLKELPTQPFPDPQYELLRPTILAEHGLDFLDAALATKHPEVTSLIRRYEPLREVELPTETVLREAQTQ